MNIEDIDIFEKERGKPEEEEMSEIIRYESMDDGMHIHFGGNFILYSVHITEVTRLQEENKDLRFKLSCHTSACISDYQDLEKRIKGLESEVSYMDSLTRAKIEADNGWSESNTRIKELEEGIKVILWWDKVKPIKEELRKLLDRR